jgi:hypothetical protein
MEECEMARAKKEKEGVAPSASAAAPLAGAAAPAPAAPEGVAPSAPVAEAVPATVAPAAAEAAPAPTTVLQGYAEWADLGRENFAAVLRANAALTEGLEAIGKEVIVSTRRSFEQAAETARALLGAKTFEDVFQLNTALAKANLTGLLERSAKLQQLSIKVANETLAPLGDRVGAALHKLSKPLAA